MRAASGLLALLLTCASCESPPQQLPVAAYSAHAQTSSIPLLVSRMRAFAATENFKYAQEHHPASTYQMTSFALLRGDIQIRGADPFEEGHFEIAVFRSRHSLSGSSEETEAVADRLGAALDQVDGVTARRARIDPVKGAAPPSPQQP